MEDLSLHLLDIVENSLRAHARSVTITVTEDEPADMVTLEVRDDGDGMPAEILAQAADPFYTTKEGKRVGLGLSLLAQAAAEAEGSLCLESEPGRGTCVRATFRRSHIDRKPLGDIAQTLRCLTATRPDVDFQFIHRSSQDG